MSDQLILAPEASVPKAAPREAQAAALTDRAHAVLLERMERFGNRLTGAHRAALRELVESFSRMAFGRLGGRLAFPLPTGMGKTQAVIAWCVALVQSGMAGAVSVAIASYRVDDLVSIRVGLLEAGVPEPLIGLRHSLGAKAPAPATGDYENRPILLVTHARVKSRKAGNVETFNSYRGQPRSLLIHDESLIASQAWDVSLRGARGDLEKLAIEAEGDPEAAEALAFFAALLAPLVAEKKAQADGARPREFYLGTEDPDDIASAEHLIRRYKRRFYAEHLEGLLGLVGHRVRIASTVAEGTIVRFVLSVPREVENIAILDASYPIRELERMDPTIRRGGTFNPDTLKRYDRVTLHLMRESSARGSASKKARPMAREIAARIADGIPANEGVIVFTFKDQPGYKYAAPIREELLRRGVDLEATVPVPTWKDGAVVIEQRPRFVWRTWGQEAASSELAYCTHVILAGVIHRAEGDIAAHMVGQAGDLTHPVDGEAVRRVRDSEVVHAAYQAASRGACRVVEDGQAREMHIHLIHRDRKLPEALRDGVMPGLNIVPWRGQTLGRTTSAEDLAETLRAYLWTVPAAVESLSSKALKEAVPEARAVSGPIFQAARDLALPGSGWIFPPGKRSLRRVVAGHREGAP